MCDLTRHQDGLRHSLLFTTNVVEQKQLQYNPWTGIHCCQVETGQKIFFLTTNCTLIISHNVLKDLWDMPFYHLLLIKRTITLQQLRHKSNLVHKHFVLDNTFPGERTAEVSKYGRTMAFNDLTLLMTARGKRGWTVYQQRASGKAQDSQPFPTKCVSIQTVSSDWLLLWSHKPLYGIRLK